MQVLYIFAFKGLLFLSVFNYEPVSFTGQILPWYYEAIAWVTMVSPLLIVPLIVCYTIYVAKRSGKVKLTKKIFVRLK